MWKKNSCHYFKVKDVIVLNRDNFISQLVDYLDDMDVLDNVNYTNMEDQKADIKRYVESFLDGYTIVEGGRVF